MDDRIEVVVADDHPIVREGMVRLLHCSEGIDVVGEAAGGPESLVLIRALRPHVALLDYWMPDLDGVAVATAIRREGLATRVLILSAHIEPRMVFDAIRRGVAGYLSKEAGRSEILNAVRAVATGREVLPAELTPGVFAEIRARHETVPPLLSARELEVLTHLARGTSVPAMARQMCVAPSTVKTHVQRLYDKLGVRDRGAAVAEAMRRRVLE